MLHRILVRLIFRLAIFFAFLHYITLPLSRPEALGNIFCPTRSQHEFSTMDLKFTETSKPAALLDGHLFRLLSESKSSRTWRCTQKDCKARFTTSLNTTDILHGMTSHCHGKTEGSVSLKKTSTKAIVQKEGRRRLHWTGKENNCHWRPKCGDRWIKSERYRQCDKSFVATEEETSAKATNFKNGCTQGYLWTRNKAGCEDCDRWRNSDSLCLQPFCNGIPSQEPRHVWRRPV